MILLAPERVTRAETTGAPCLPSSISEVIQRFYPLKQAEAALGRKISIGEIRALVKASEGGSARVYLPNEIEEQNQRLLRAGFTEQEIRSLRLGGVLPNEMIVLPRTVPTTLREVNLGLHAADREMIRAAQAGKVLSYIIDQNGLFHLVDQTPEFKNDAVWLIHDTRARARTSVVAMEAGRFLYDKDHHRFRLAPTAGFDLTPEESEAVLADLRRSNPDQKFERENAPKRSKNRTIDCMEMLSAEAAGQHFVRDRLLGEVSTTAAILGMQEVMGAHRIKNGQSDIIIAEILGTLTVSPINSVICRGLVVKGSGIAVSYISRAAMRGSNIWMQKKIYDYMDIQSQKDRSSALTNYNLIWSALRLPMTDLADKFYVNALPGLLFDMCTKHPRMRIILNPGTIRFVEQAFWSLAFYGLRVRVVGY